MTADGGRWCSSPSPPWKAAVNAGNLGITHVQRYGEIWDLPRDQEVTRPPDPRCLPHSSSERGERARVGDDRALAAPSRRRIYYAAWCAPADEGAHPTLFRGAPSTGLVHRDPFHPAILTPLSARDGTAVLLTDDPRARPLARAAGARHHLPRTPPPTPWPTSSWTGPRAELRYVIRAGEARFVPRSWPGRAGADRPVPGHLRPARPSPRVSDAEDGLLVTLYAVRQRDLQRHVPHVAPGRAPGAPGGGSGAWPPSGRRRLRAGPGPLPGYPPCKIPPCAGPPASRPSTA